MLAVRPTVHQDTTLLRARGDRPFRCFESGVLNEGARLRAVHVELLDWAELGELGLQGLISDRVNDTLEGKKKNAIRQVAEQVLEDRLYLYEGMRRSYLRRANLLVLVLVHLLLLLALLAVGRSCAMRYWSLRTRRRWRRSSHFDTHACPIQSNR